MRASTATGHVWTQGQKTATRTPTISDRVQSMSNPDRDQRLAAKLRENLRRRKAQAKARTAPTDQSDQQEATGTSKPEPTGRKDT
ncbi:MAG TPA: hypothetical protein DIT93_14770 [Pelagibacterium sp.]|nr:hypothetical protein [Pelagibacterium sp.]